MAHKKRTEAEPSQKKHGLGVLVVLVGLLVLVNAAAFGAWYLMQDDSLESPSDGTHVDVVQGDETSETETPTSIDTDVRRLSGSRSSSSGGSGSSGGGSSSGGSSSSSDDSSSSQSDSGDSSSDDSSGDSDTDTHSDDSDSGDGTDPSGFEGPAPNDNGAPAEPVEGKDLTFSFKSGFG